MRIGGVTVVRDEEDILEASIRHNLGVLSALTVVDHGSSDATPSILDALVREGLPIEVVRDDSIGYLQSRITTEQVRRTLAAGADLCIPIDADEFLRIRSREAFERAVADADPARHLVMPWVHFLPDLDLQGDIVSRLRRARRTPTDAHGMRKVVVRHRLLETPGAVVGIGNHEVVPPSGMAGDRHVLLDGDVVSMAHVPVRGVAQYTAKMTVGYLSRLLANPDDMTNSFQFREAFEAIMAGRTPTRESLEAVVANYGVSRERWIDPATTRWIEDPFIGDIALRYTPERPPVPLARVLAFGERVAAEVARTTGGV
ncbi:hypothetical protein BURK1_01228 [Burkholderiales bacterium]|nr:hypothetical protein BURK1_01228 [Burkholderiales bacterium]